MLRRVHDQPEKPNGQHDQNEDFPDFHYSALLLALTRGVQPQSLDLTLEDLVSTARCARIGILRPRSTSLTCAETAHEPHSTIRVIYDKLAIEGAVTKSAFQLDLIGLCCKVPDNRPRERFGYRRGNIHAFDELQNAEVCGYSITAGGARQQ